MRPLAGITLTLLFSGPLLAAAPEDRFVWVFGWGLQKDSDVTEIAKLLEKAGKSGFNGAVLSAGLDHLSLQDEAYLRRLEAIAQACRKNNLELIPAAFSIGYGGGILSHNRHLAEGLPVEDAPFVAHGGEAKFAPDPAVKMINGGFEEFSGKKLKGFNFYDQPGEVGFLDTQVFHSGKASLRMENFQSNPHGHGRVMQTVKVRPHRSYRVSIWVKTENLKPNAFRFIALSPPPVHELAPCEFHLPPATDWRKVSYIVNSLDHDTMNLYAGVWGGKAGKFWLDDWTIEEVGPINVLRRPGTPVTVKGEDGTACEEGRDYAPLKDPNFKLWDTDRGWPALKLLPGGRIREGQTLRVSWYHPMVINDSQVTVCMGEPEVYDILEKETRLLCERLHPHRVLLNMDEVRMGGTCRACAGKNMGELLGQCVTRQVEFFRKCNPKIQVYVWSDMLDPHHNAHGDYYLVKGDFTGSWKHVPKDLTIAVWGGKLRPESLKFFSGEGFATLGSCYYDADNLDEVKEWMQLGRSLPGLRGYMYTTWDKKYDLLAPFGEMMRQ